MQRFDAEQIFETVRLKTDPQERARYLDDACGDDADLRAKVEALLAAAKEPPSSLLGFDPDTTIPQSGHSDNADPGSLSQLVLSEKPGQRIGRFKLLQRIGEGGFGVVYLAEQEKPVRRRVALKIIKLGMDTKQVIARFETERQVLAVMDHPSVAKVLDAGATETGRPFFVMELVKGTPITNYCDRNSLSFPDRLKLFIQVCGAVQHAHQKGIIHRDIKPSNILITIVDDKPIPKVIDFGIAKATEQTWSEHTMFTEFGQFLGTPAYMSPEQTDSLGTDIDTRSDIYSLGVVLYELVTGSTPFDVKTLRAASLDEIKRMIREEEPNKPSTRLSTLGKELETVAQRRRIESKKLPRILRGDLDWIIMKAIEKDRARRYETANGLAMDIKRYLSDEPVAAGPPGASYRLRKLIRRNKHAFAAAALVFVALVLGIAGTSYGLLRAVQAEGVAQAERDEAKRQAEIAQAVNDFLNDDLLATVSPSVEAGRGRDVLMRDVLDEAARRIDEAASAGGRLADKPLIEAAIRETIARTYRQLGLYDEAREQAERAVQLRRLSLGAQDPETLSAVVELATVLWLQARFDEAETACEEALAGQQAVLGEDHQHTLSTLRLRGNIAMDRGHWDEAEDTLTDVLDRQQTTVGPEHPDTLQTQHDLAVLYMRQSRFEEAEQLYKNTLQAQQRTLGPEHPDTLITMQHLGEVLISEERYGEAEKHLSETIELQRRVFGDEHPRTLISRRDRADARMGLRKFEEAEAELKDLKQRMQRVWGPQHPETLMLTAVLGLIQRDRGDVMDGAPTLTEVIEAQRKTLGVEHPTTLISMINLAESYRRGDRFDIAVPLAEELVVEARRVLGPEHKWTLKAMWTLGTCYRQLGRMDEAEPLLVEVLQTRRRVFGDDEPATIHGIGNLALLRRAQGRTEEALRLAREYLEGWQSSVGPDDPRTLSAMSFLAANLRDSNFYDESEQLYVETIDASKRAMGPDHPDTLIAISSYAQLLFELDRYEEAEALWLDVLDRRQRVLGPLHPAAASTVRKLWKLWQKTNEPDKARQILSGVFAVDPQSTAESNELAWMLLNCEPADEQDPARALQIIRKANEDSEYKNPHHLDTLAAALYRTGAIGEAIEIQRNALEYAPATVRADYEARLLEYESAWAGKDDTSANAGNQ